MADFVLAEGLKAASLRALAGAAGVSDRMLLYYFRDKDEALAATLGAIAGRMQAMMDTQAPGERLPVAELRALLLDSLFTPAAWPFMCVWLEIAALSARGDRPMREVGNAIGRGFLAWGEARIEGADPAGDAHRLLVEIEGLVLLTSLGLGEPPLSDRG
jgi:AcrR family transcriptional regulator